MSSYEVHQPMVFTDVGGQRVAMPASQSKGADYNSALYNFAFPQVPTNLFRNNGVMYRGQLPRNSGQLPKIKAISLQVNLTLNSAVTLAPATYWFPRIEVRSGSSGSPIYTMYDDSMTANCFLNIPSSNKGMFRNLAMSDDPRWTYTAGEQLQAGQYVFYIPLLGPWDNSAYHIGANDAELLWDFYPATQATISGTSTDVDCTNLALVIETEDLQDGDRTEQDRRYRMVPHLNTFLEAVPVYVPSQTVTASSAVNVDLSSIIGKVAFLMLLVRANGASNASNGNYLYLNLGDDAPALPASLDFCDSSGTSLYGSGTPASCRYLRNEVAARYFPGCSDWFAKKSVYLIPFADRVQGPSGAYGGAMKGYWEFVPGQKTYLRIVPGPALTNEVMTVTANSTPAAGYVRIKYKNSISSPLIVTSTTNQLQSAFNALRDAIQDDITVTVNAQLSAGATTTWTLSSQFKPCQVDNQNLIQILSEGAQTGGAAPVSFTTTRTTVGNGGWSTGSVTISVLAYRFRTLVTANGQTRAVDA